MNTQDKQINSAVNSCRMALYNNNKAKSTNKTTRLINNLFKKYRKDDTENENEDENTKLDTLSIGLQLKEAVDSIFDPTTGMSEEEKKKFVQKLYRKLESGKKLSADEMQYLRKNDPVTYAKAAKVQVLRESLKKQLKSATSKEKAADIYTQAMSRISEDDPARKEIMAAYDDVYKEFRKSDEYKALPNTEKEAKELVQKIPSIDATWINSEREREHNYKDAVQSNDPERLVGIIKLIYGRKKARAEQGKKTTAVDGRYYDTAERLLYSELELAMHKNKDEILAMIRDCCNDE